MNKEEFIENYLKGEYISLCPPYCFRPFSNVNEGRLFLALIGSIHDLQEQINQLQEKYEK